MKKMNVGASSSSSSSLLWRLGESASTNQGCETTHITDDIWFEIFLLLPFTSIFKCKCVSKIWLSLLSNPYFINKWIKYHNSNKSVPWALVYVVSSIKFNDVPMTISGISYSIASLGVGENSKFISAHDGSSFKFLPPQLPERSEKLYAVGSSNGLVLSAQTKLLYAVGSSNGLVLLAQTLENQTKYFVGNPLTQNWVSLPPPLQVVASMETVVGFVCECLPSTSTSYGVVRIPEFGRNKIKFSIDVFSSDKNRWTTCEVSFPKDVSWRCSSLVSHNGDLLWIEEHNRILAYNHNRNECRLIDLPALEVEGGYSLCHQCLNVSEGFICCARVWNKESGFSLSLWVLMENWQLLQKDIQLDDVFKIFKMRRWKIFVAFDPLDKNVVMISIRNYIWVYNIQTRTLEKLCEVRSERIREVDTIAQITVLKLWPTILPAPGPGLLGDYSI